MTVHKSSKGETVNMEDLRRANETVVAAGNTNLNARGDMLGKNGQIVKPAHVRYHETRTTVTVDTVSIKGDAPDEELSDAPAKKEGNTSKISAGKKGAKKVEEITLPDGSIQIGGNEDNV